MIKLSRAAKPTFLTDDLVARLTAEFETTTASVWNFDALKEALLTQSHGKCAYCECNLREESKYMEVEHFECKNTYPKKVVHWENLLPSCKRCNGSKGEHDVNSAPIVEPFLTEPRLHLKFHLYRFEGVTDVGTETIEVVDLNNHDRAIFPRFQIGEAVHRSVEIAIERLEAYEQRPITGRRNKLVGHVQALLKECQPASAYSATAATALHRFGPYARLRDRLIVHNLWSSELASLDTASLSIAF